MNKVINVFSAILLVFYCTLVMFLVYDLSISSALSVKNLPYKVEITTGIAVLIFLLGILRIKRKWQGANDMKRFKGFHFVRGVSKSARNLGLVYAGAEALFMVLLIAFLVNVTALSSTYVFPMIVVISILLIEALVFIFKFSSGGESFRIGIDKKAVAYYNREMHIYYFTGLTRIELHQDMINFQYKDDLNIFLRLEVIKKEDITAFRDALIKTLEEYTAATKGKIIYIDDAFRTLE